MFGVEEVPEKDTELLVRLLKRDVPPSMREIQNNCAGWRVEYFHYIMFRAVREMVRETDKD